MPKIKKIRKKKSKKLSNVVPLRKDLKLIEKDEPILSIEEQEREKTNAFARKICDEIDNFIKETKLTADYAYYHFLFHLKQRTIFNVSYALFKEANDASTNEITRNLANYLKEKCPELKTDTDNHTIN